MPTGLLTLISLMSCRSLIFTTAHGRWTYAEITPPAKFVHDEEGRRGQAVTSLVSGGCIISGAVLRRSLLFTGVQINSFASVENAVVLPYVNVGRHARLNNVVIDRGVRIPEGLVVGEDPELDAKRFRTTAQGISLITSFGLDCLLRFGARRNR
jgi:glucose-1-phosphate adenylyltransferase